MRKICLKDKNNHLFFTAAFVAILAVNFLTFFLPISSEASSLDEDQIHLKESKAEEFSRRAENLKAQLEEDRQAALRSQEKIWQDFNQSLELDRKRLQDQLEQLNQKQRLFERELEKKKTQDIVRLKEKEDEIQSLLGEMDRLKAEAREDRKQFEKTPGQPELPSDLQEGDQEILVNGAVRVGQSGQEIPEAKPFPTKNIYQEYYIEIGDLLEVEVWRVPDLSRSVSVRPDGRISMPVVGDVEVAGLSLTEFRDLLTKKFSEYVRNPQISISVRSFGGRKFAILGQISSPGIYRFQQEMSLLEGIALAGGFKDFSRRGKVMVIRGDVHKQPQVKIISANMENVLRKGMLSENITIMPNDIIYVGRDLVGDYRDVIDNVISPFFETAINYFVLHSASRADHNS